MMLTLLKSKIHRAKVTGSELHYEGSITLPRDLMDQANMLAHEQVDILNVENGARFTTYILEAPAGSKEICINGPAARLVQKGDTVIVCAYAQMSEEEAKRWKPTVLLMDEQNKVKNG